MKTFILSVKLPVGIDGLSPTSLWAAVGQDEGDAMRALQQRLPSGMKIIEASGVANPRLTNLLNLPAGAACELSTGTSGVVRCDI